MSSRPSPAPGVAPAVKAGLVICAILGLVDVAGVLGIGADDGPPLFVIIAGLILGLITLIALPRAWRDEGAGRTAVVASRIVSAVLGIPAFVADDAPDWAPIAVGVGLVLTVVAVVLIYAGRRSSSATQFAA